MADDGSKGEALTEYKEAAISELKAAYLQGLKDADKSQKAVGPEGLRYAAIVMSSAGLRLGKDRDLGVCLIAGNDFIDDKFVVEAFKRFLRDLEQVDPQAAEDLKHGRAMEWSGDGEVDADIPDFEAGGADPYAVDPYAGASMAHEDDMGGEVR